jgi:histidinol-phosphate/aromatic aminotransferase/cobyric acid decarboxylase-like protein/GTP:adenosylcobinamide-phosphate guanylyltransferase
MYGGIEMQAIILAAGMGTRLKKLTSNNTKCMVKVNGVTLIERALSILDRKSLSRIVLVVGYQAQNLIEFVKTLNIKTPVIFIENNIYDKTNNIYSLTLAKEYACEEDTLLLESDLIFEEALIDALLDDKRETLALVDKFENWMDGTCTILDDNDCIVDFVAGKYLDFANKDEYYKTVNIYKFSSHFSRNTYFPFLEAYAGAMGNNEYYESVIKLIAMLETKEIRAKRLTGQKWYEIDDAQDLDIAESIFANNISEQYDAIAGRYGGYWRYPKLLDFCYLVNPYFPPKKMVEEIKSNFTELMSQYPSGLRVNSLLAAKNFGLEQEHIVVGNGAAELIKSLMENSGFKRVGFIRPTFEEYPNRLACEHVIYDCAENDFRYSAEDIMSFYDDKEIDAMVLINPDNPTGNYIPVEDLITLAEWTGQRGIAFVVDESFVDFVSMEDKDGAEAYTLLKDSLLRRFGRLYVVKSISKSYGVPGFRLGILASSDENTITRIKKDVAIWNINSYGEFFMQILQKYQKDYAVALKKIKADRSQLVEGLKKIEGLKVYPSQANYVMCEITTDRYTGRSLAERLLSEDIFIKDLTAKINNGRQYVRLAVRDTADNEYLLSVLRKCM